MASLRDLRERVMLSQTELALACGVDRQTVWLWESRRVRPSPEHQRKLVEVLRCAPDDVLAAIKPSKPKEDEKERPAA
jgi:DNA-binding transcriptional regulator YiaG